MDSGDLQGALRDFDELVRVSPRNPEALQLRGVARSLAGRSKDALADFSKAHELDPSKPEGVLNLSECLIMNGKAKEASDVASALLSAKADLPSKAVALYLCCVAAQLQGSGSKELLAQFDETMKEDFDPKWNTAPFESWLKGSSLPEDVKANVAALTERIKGKAKASKDGGQS